MRFNVNANKGPGGAFELDLLGTPTKAETKTGVTLCIPPFFQQGNGN
jgi:hypothetical protein